MCGIVGWINFKENIKDNYTVIDDMKNSLLHRGPDENGSYISNHALIGHTRLVVIDPVGGKQPMIKTHNDSTYILTYNGELYNTEELRTELKSYGHYFKTKSDTEVLLTSYIHWGNNCVKHLNGIYSFGVFNKDLNEFFLARDPFGVKPLFYTIKNNSLIFGSEIKSLFKHPEIKPELSSLGLNEIFALGPARTPGCGVFDDIFEIKPGYFALFNHDGFKTYQYWSLKSEPHKDSLEETKYTIKSLVFDSIKRQLVSDVPLSTFLSGGLDSSGISSIAAIEFNKVNKPLQTFSIDYVGNETYFKPNYYQPNSDNYFIQKVSEKYNTNHHTIKLSNEDLASSLFEALNCRDIPGMADIDSSLLLFCKEVKKHCDVSVSGECADELFGGYPWFKDFDLLNAKSFPWSNSLDLRHNILSNDLKNKINIYEYSYQKFKDTIDNTPITDQDSGDLLYKKQLTYLNVVWFMATLLERKDRMSMSCALEVRVPYCDYRLAQYVYNVPWEYKSLYNQEKGLLRDSLSSVLPDEVTHRKKSPYPKTHNPIYENIIKSSLYRVLKSNNEPLNDIIDKDFVLKLMSKESDYGNTWYGQLMALPQLYAYLLQINQWIKKYKININV